MCVFDVINFYFSRIDGSYNIAAKTVALFKDIVTREKWNSAE